jgi:hypothetical protein
VVEEIQLKKKQAVIKAHQEAQKRQAQLEQQQAAERKLKEKKEQEERNKLDWLTAAWCEKPGLGNTAVHRMRAWG